MAEPRLLVVVLNYRTAEMTLRAAEAALREMDGLSAEMVIVDNESGDGSLETMHAGGRGTRLDLEWTGQGCGVRPQWRLRRRQQLWYQAAFVGRIDPGLRVLFEL